MSKKVRLLADHNILIHKNFIPREIEIHTFNPTEGLPETVNDYDALLVRTVNRIDESTQISRNTNIKFIGSATAGIDHVNLPWLKKQGIKFAHSPGCNASSVGEYVAVALLCWSLQSGSDLSVLRAGIIGAGHTGTVTERLLNNLSVQCVRYDPPKAAFDTEFESATLEEVLSCDILTFHTPLTYTGQWPTYHWLNREKLKNRSYQLIINAARGGVIDEEALLTDYQKGNIKDFILDVWENEPVFDDKVAKSAFISTPHIAGYSIQSKQEATRIVMGSLCKFFGIPSQGFRFTPPAPPAPEINSEYDNRDLQSLIRELNPIYDYTRRLSSLIDLSSDEKKRRFQQIRTEFPLRHEHPYYKLDENLLRKYPALRALGFGVKQA
jgi:erythronate-4-phosphate dehydrogenase